MPPDGTLDPGIGRAESLDSEPARSTEAPATRPPSRREIIEQKRRQGRRNRPFLIAGLLLFVTILTVPGYGYVQQFVLPPREIAVQINDVIYTRGDVVDFVRFHQRLALENGDDFRIADQLLASIETISENEIAYQKAPLLGITVIEAEVQGAIRETMGFPGLSTADAAEPAVKADIAEAFRQLLNRSQLSEEAYTAIIRKGLFREKARRALQLNVPLLQRQVRVFALEFSRDTDPDIERARRQLATGDPIAQVTVDHSQELAVARTRGELGWIPEFVVDDFDVETLLFGVNDEGEPNLPVRTLGDGIWDGENGVYRYYYIDETSDARELDPEDLETLTDHALAVWLEDQRVALDNYKLVFDSDIFQWITGQIEASDIELLNIPTPVPGSEPLDLGDLIQGTN